MLRDKRTQYLAIGLSSVGVAYLCYRIYQNHSHKPPPKVHRGSIDSVTEPNLRTVHSNYSEFYFDKLEQIRQIVGRLADRKPTIEDVYLMSPLIIVDEFQKYTREIRKRRRLIRKVNEEQYVALIRAYDVEVEELLQRGREELIDELEISPMGLEEMESSYGLFESVGELRKKAMGVLREKAFGGEKARRVPREKLRKIMEEEVAFSRNRMYERLKVKLQEDEELEVSQEETYSIITTLRDDIIYEKYGYEREDIDRHLGELPLLAKDVAHCRQGLFAHIVQTSLPSLDSNSDDLDLDPDYHLDESLKTAKTKLNDSAEEVDP